MPPPTASAVQRSRLVRILTVATAIIGIAYPFLIYFRGPRVYARMFLGGAFFLFGVRVWLARSQTARFDWRSVAIPCILPGVVLSLAFIFARRSLFLFWPTAVSAALLSAFGRTLITPPSFVERLARLQKPVLGDGEIAYCRRVTQLWCLFFLANGTAALALALTGSLKAWALYNGLISYGLIGTLFAAEYVYRHWRFRPAGAPLTVWMNRWSPAIPQS